MTENEYAVFVKQLENIWPNYQLTYQEYRNPTPDVIIRFVDRFLIDINENADEIIREILNKLSDPDPYMDLGYPIVFFLLIKKFLHRIQVSTSNFNNFKVGTLLSPNNRVTKMLFYHLKNFLLFKTKVLREINVIHERKKSTIYKMEHATKFLDQTKTMENNMAMKHGKMVDLIVQLEERITKVYSEINEVMMKVSEEGNTIECCSAQIYVVDNKEKDLLEKITALDNEEEELTEYDRLSAETDKIELELKDLEEADSELTPTLRKKTEQETKFEQRIEADFFNEPTENVLDLFKDDLVIDLKNKKQILTSTIAAFNSVDVEIKNDDSAIQGIEEQCESLDKQWKDKENLLKHDQKVAEKELEHLEAKHSRRMKEKVNLDSDICEMEKKHKEIDEQLRKIRQFWSDKYLIMRKGDGNMKRNFENSLKTLLLSIKKK